MRLSQLLVTIGCTAAQDIDYSQYVNPFIGSEGAIPGYSCRLIASSFCSFVLLMKQSVGETSS